MNRITTFIIILLTAVTTTLSAQSIEFKDELIDVGLTQWYHPVTATYTFTNVTDLPLTIQYVDPGCGCMEPEWTRGMIQPGASGRVTVTYNAEMLGRFEFISRALIDGKDPRLSVFRLIPFLYTLGLYFPIAHDKPPKKRLPNNYK